jgi:2,3-bisphosphoglycerate-independent phosphoglycerate mutase
MAADMFVEVVPGATGEIESNLAAKAEYSARYLERFDFVLTHVNAPDEAGHQKDPVLKQKTIERADREVIGPLLSTLNERYSAVGYRMLVCGDHMTRSDDGRHLGVPVPAALFGTGVSASGVSHFSEAAADVRDVIDSLDTLRFMRDAR